MTLQEKVDNEWLLLQEEKYPKPIKHRDRQQHYLSVEIGGKEVLAHPLEKDFEYDTVRIYLVPEFDGLKHGYAAIIGKSV